MNMRDQVTEAITDYSQGRNGFEQAQKNAVWDQQIRPQMKNYLCSQSIYIIFKFL